jgi:hypothetical protein
VSDEGKDLVHIVFGGSIVLAAYRGDAADSAELHRRCVTGALVTSVEILTRVPLEIMVDLDVEFQGEASDDTPIDGVVTPRTITVDEIDDA